MRDISCALMNETENLGVRSHEIEIMQADAWFAICALCKSLDTELGTASEVWSRAISHTDECYSGWAVFKDREFQETIRQHYSLGF
jgi:hypothetical protein